MATTTWIVAADESRARVLQVADREHLVEIDSMQNPDARRPDRELRSDAEPRFSGHGGVGKPGASRTSGPASDRQEQTSAVEHSVHLFAKEVGRYLDKARTEHRYDELVLIAPPRFLGTLRKELDKEVEKLVAEELPKDLSWFNERDLERYLKRRG